MFSVFVIKSETAVNCEFIKSWIYIQDFSCDLMLILHACMHACQSPQSYLTLCDPMAVALQAPLSVEFFRQEYGVGCHFLLQGIFLIQGSNPGLLHCRHILSHLSHQGTWLYHLFICWATLDKSLNISVLFFHHKLMGILIILTSHGVLG